MFIPLNDQNPLKNISYPIVTWALIAANIAAFLYQNTVDFNGLIISGGLTPACLTDERFCPTEAWPAPLTLISHMFLHGDIWHLGGNLVFLFIFGDNVEDAMGHVRYLLFYVLCGILAGTAHSLSVSTGTLDVPLIGASGAISGLIGAYLILHPKVHMWVLVLARIPLRLPAYVVIGGWLAWQIYFVVFRNPEDPVAWWAHIGGFIAGAALIFVFRKRNIVLLDRNLGHGPTAV